MEGISKALAEDTTKKYSDEGLDLVETLKRRCGGDVVVVVVI